MNKEDLPARLASTLEVFSQSLGKSYGADLISVILYGSLSSGEYSAGYSNVNMLIVLATAGLTDLGRAYSVVNQPRFREFKPLFFTEREIIASLDVFPIEFLDIIENHCLIYGRDVLKDLKVDDANLRFQCEHELRSRLIDIRRLYLHANSRQALERALYKSFNSVVHILRNMIRLRGERPPYLKDAILTESEKILGINTTLLREILWAKSKRMNLSVKELDALLYGLSVSVEDIIAMADRS